MFCLCAVESVFQLRMRFLHSCNATLQPGEELVKAFQLGMRFLHCCNLFTGPSAVLIDSVPIVYAIPSLLQRSYSAAAIAFTGRSIGVCDFFIAATHQKQSYHASGLCSNGVCDLFIAVTPTSGNKLSLGGSGSNCVFDVFMIVTSRRGCWHRRSCAVSTGYSMSSLL